MSAQFSRKFEYVEASLTPIDESPKTITSNVLEFTYTESIFAPFVCGNIVFQDSDENLVGTLPIQGGEKVSIKIKDPNDEIVEYNFILWAIKDRTTKDRVQIYNMKVISEEAVTNESVKITRQLKGNIQTIANNVLKNELKTTKEVYAESSKFNINLVPGRSTPFSVLQRIAAKGVSGKVNTTSGGSRSAAEAGAQQIKGTAGYFFYENKNGYFFESIDKTCSSGGVYGGRPIIGDYYYDPNQSDNGKKILSFGFENEIDIMKKMRLGAYSSMVCYYNMSTGKYEEYQWSLTDTFKNMSKLGTQSKLGKYQEQASKKPTRIMSMVLDHETWYNGEEATEDGENTEYPDFVKYYLSQSIGRLSILASQRMTIGVPGDPMLVVGEKINVYLPNTVPGEERKKKSWDEENSGTYLISKVEHTYSSENAQVITKLELIRDSLGIPSGSSNVK